MAQFAERIFGIRGGNDEKKGRNDYAVILEDLEPETTESIARRPLWTRWWCLWVFVGCLAAEWIVRKRIGLA